MVVIEPKLSKFRCLFVVSLYGKRVCNKSIAVVQAGALPRNRSLPRSSNSFMCFRIIFRILLLKSFLLLCIGPKFDREVPAIVYEPGWSCENPFDSCKDRSGVYNSWYIFPSHSFLNFFFVLMFSNNKFSGYLLFW